jgi:hypothetical protein
MKQGCYKTNIAELLFGLMAVTNKLLQQEDQPLKLPQNLPKNALGLVVYVSKI